MRPERSLSDGSAVYKDNVVGPSLADIDLFKNPNRPSLKNFPTRVDLVPAVATSAAVLFIGGCNTSSGSEQKPAGEVLGAAEGQNAFETSSKLLNDFINKWNNKPADFDNAYGTQCVDLVQFWRKAQGGPSFVGDFAYQMFGENPDFYDSIPTSDGTNPQAGDILDWSNKYNNIGGHTGIATGKLDSQGKEIVFEQNDPDKSKSHLQSYSLDDPTLLGWLKAKNSPTEISDKPNSEAILDQYLNSEGLSQNDDNYYVKQALNFWFKTYTSKQNPVSIEGYNEPLTLQINTNFNDWASNIPTLIANATAIPYTSNGTIDTVFDIKYKFTGHFQSQGEIQLKNLAITRFGITNFSPADEANGLQRMEDVYIKFIYRVKKYDHDTKTWEEFGDWQDDFGQPISEAIQYKLQNGQIDMASRNKNISYGNGYPSNDYDNPTREIPRLISFVGYN